MRSGTGEDVWLKCLSITFLGCDPCFAESLDLFLRICPFSGTMCKLYASIMCLNCSWWQPSPALLHRTNFSYFLLTKLELRHTEVPYKAWAPGKPVLPLIDAMQCSAALLILSQKEWFPFSLIIKYSCFAFRTYFCFTRGKCFSFPSSTCAKQQEKKIFFKDSPFILLAWTQAGSRKLLPCKVSDKLALRAWQWKDTAFYFLGLRWKLKLC